MIAAGTTFSGTFEYAVEQVLETPGIKNSEYPLEACVYNNEPPLLRITRLGDQKEECR
nr:TcpQ domain-containing protein [Limnobacter sp. UBA1615]